ncbi:MAG: hypothetical protein IIU97_02105, partial [Bacteroidaceae bacterium]|nr:hypothetical protein [Bacteroidaceae bacterium]
KAGDKLASLIQKLNQTNAEKEIISQEDTARAGVIGSIRSTEKRRVKVPPTFRVAIPAVPPALA